MKQTKLLEWFKNLSKESVALAGGKGASLGEMTQAGIPVPNGFVILSDSFEKFLEETDLNIELDSILDQVNHKEMQSIENASEEIKALIMEAKMPKDIQAEIVASFKNLGANFVAVRSSATSEDSSSAAWAGQLDSFLNTTEDKVLENVKRCWASLFTPRAIFYRFEKGLHNTKISVAVVVQKMVESEVSGIAFSVHPVTQDRNQLIIEAGFGLGEAIVSGQITPDAYVVEKVPRRIIDKNVSEQERGLFKIETGGNEWKSVIGKGSEQKLSDKQILELSEIILRIENHYGFPCDIEWAYEKGKFYIVQSRPITTLTDKSNDKQMPSVEEKKEEKVKKKAKILDEKNNIALKEGKPDLSKFKISKIIRRTNSPLYNSLMRVGATIENPELEFDSRMKTHIILDNDIYYIEEEFTDLKNRMTEPMKKDSDFLTRYLDKSLKDSLDLINWSKKQNNSKDLLKTYTEFTDRSLKVMSHLWPCLGPEDWILAEIEKALAKRIDPKKNFSEYKRVLTLLTASTDLSEITLRRIGMLEGKDLKKAHEEYAWVTDQGLYFDYESFESYKNELALIKNPKAELKKIYSELEELKLNREQAIKKYKIDKETLKLCELTQRLPHIRLIRRNCVIQAAYYMKDFFARVQKEVSVRINDAYYWELRDLLEGKEVDLETINKRKETYSFIVYGNEFYDYDKETGTKIKQEIEATFDNSGEIKGQTACVGKVTGVARVLFSSKEIGKVNRGDILVTSMTMPDFVPAMEKAIAFVTDEGGLSCHAAIVAREMRKPCIIGTKNATKKIKDGDLIEVDAERGTVKIIKSSEPTASLEEKNDSLNKEDLDYAKKFLQNNSFDLKEAKCSLLAGDIIFREYAEKNCFGESYSPLFIPYEKTVLAQVIPEERMKGLERKDWEVFINDKKMFERAINEANSVQKKIDKISLSTNELSMLSDEKLIEYLSKLEILMRVWWRFGSVGEEKGLVVEEKIVPSLMKNHLLSPDQAREYVMTQTMPHEQSIFSKERMAFLDLCIFASKDKKLLSLLRTGSKLDDKKYKQFNKKMAEYSKKYFYSRTDFYSAKVLDFGTLSKLVLSHCDSTPLEKILEEKEHIIQNFKKLISDKKILSKKIKLSNDEKKYLGYFSALQEWLDERKLSMLKHFYYLFISAEEVSKRKKINYATIALMSPSELKQLVSGANLDLEQVKLREDGAFFVYRQGQKEVLFTKKEAKELREIVYGSNDSSAVLTGTVASKGKQVEKKISGSVRVIFDPSKDTLNEGEVLVTSMTRPEFVPIMKKACAIITDEGGIACHAAIVSRELGIPCIIGTKKATKILSDGDKVEVDVEKGIVNILSKKLNSPSLDISVEDEFEYIKKKMASMKWEKWLERPFQAFTLSLSEEAGSKENFAKIGVPNLELRYALFQNGFWYYSQGAFDEMDEELEKYLQKHSIKTITSNLAKFKDESEKKINSLIKSKITPEEKISVVFDILTQNLTYLWLAHGMESFYNKKLKNEVPKYVKNDVDKFIGDASFPKKKNLNTMLDDLLKSKKSPQEVAKIAGWTKVRDGFSDPYTVEEIIKLRAQLPVLQKHKNVKVPSQLKSLFSEVQELVFFRTERTDVLYYLYFLARPIFLEVAQKHNIQFKEMRYYRAKSFVLGKPEKYSADCSLACCEGKVLFKNGPIIEVEDNLGKVVSGTVAFKGKVTGIVKIVKDVSELDKVKQGDILVTQMTFPSFIPAMVRAIAFVTDEGGITCHAAIVAREMQKPCIIGTKIATKILKDGDLVEVDANSGVVRIITSQKEVSNNGVVKTTAWNQGKVVPSRSRPKKVVGGVFPSMFTQEYIVTDSMKKIYGVKAHGLFYSWIGEDIVLSVDDENDFRQIGMNILEKIVKEPKWLDGLITWSEKQRDSLMNLLLKGLPKEKINSISNQKIAQVYEDYAKMYVNFHLKNTPPWWIGSEELEKEFAEYVKKGVISEKDLALLLEPGEYISSIAEEEIELLEIAAQIKKLKKVPNQVDQLPSKIKNMLKYHTKKYFHIPFGYSNGVIWDEVYFFNKVKKIISEVSDPKKESKEKLLSFKKKFKAQNKLIKKLKLPKRLVLLIQSMHKLAYLQDLKKDFQTRSHPHLNLVLAKEVEKRLSLPKDYFFFLTVDEVKKSLKEGKIDPVLMSELAKRDAGSVLVFRDNKYTWMLGEEAIEFCKVNGITFSTEGIKEVRGTSASGGAAVGKIKICATSKEIIKVNPGDILVAAMTTPDFVSAMKTAGAIVTDEGGITCHAAIVGRELGKPVIIATKIATKVFKDGDLVEVDANKGTVKLIEPNLLDQKVPIDFSNDFWKNSFKWNLDARPIFVSNWFELASEPKRPYYFSWKIVGRFSSTQLEEYQPRSTIENIGNQVINELLSGNDSFHKEVLLVLEEVKEAFAVCEKYKNTASPENFELWSPKIDELFCRTAQVLYGFDFTVNEYLKKLQQTDPNLFNVLSQAMVPRRPSFLTEADKYLLSLRKQFPKDEKKVYSEFMKKFAWFQNSYKGIFDITPKWLSSYKPQEITSVEIKEKIVVPPKYALLVETTKDVFALRDDKKKLSNMSIALYSKWINEIAKIVGANSYDLEWLSTREVNKIYKGELKYLDLAKRYSSMGERIVAFTENGFVDLDGSVFDKVRAEHKGGASLKTNSDLDSKTWSDSFRWKYEAWPFFTSVYMLEVFPGKSKYYVEWANFINKFENGHLEAYLPKKDILAKGKIEIDELLNGQTYFATEFRSLLKRVHSAVDNCEKVRKNGTYSNLDSWWPEVQEALSDVAGLLFGFDYTLNDWMKEMQTKDPELFKLLSASIKENKPSFINEAINEVVSLVNKYPNDFDKVYLEFMKKFSWFQNSYAGEFNITKEWLRKFYEENKSKANQNHSSAKSSPPKGYELLCELASEAISFRDDKKKLLLVAVELMNDWLRENCEKKSLNFDEMKWLSVDEVVQAVNGNEKMINYAKECASKNKRIGMMTLKGYEDISEEFFIEVEKIFLGSDRITQLSGMTGSKGKVIGRAKVILDAKKDEHKLQVGDILVTSMTRPEFLPLMNKASAFVTDEGGVTCHAAIVAREMNKPCIISTKIATQVIKDNDLIEVDGDKGVVKLLDDLSKNSDSTNANKFREVSGDEKEKFFLELKKMIWVPWLNRPYNVFWGTSNWMGVNKEYFKKVGLEGLSIDAYYYEDNIIHYPEKFLTDGIKYFDDFFKTHSVEDLSKMLQNVHQENILSLRKISEDDSIPVRKKLDLFAELVRSYVPFLWIILPLEAYFNNRIQNEVPRYVKRDYSKFVGDMSLPRKKNVYALMLSDLHGGVPLSEVQQKYGWSKSLDVFTDFYTVEELESIKKSHSPSTLRSVNIPLPLAPLSEELKELTFFRTDRTDKFCNFFGEARGLLKKVAASIGVNFKQLADYDVNSIIKNDPKKYDKLSSYYSLNNAYLINETFDLNDSLIKKAKNLNWVYWLDRPYPPFMSSLMYGGVDREYHIQVGLDSPGFGYTSILYQYPVLYYSKEIAQQNFDALTDYFKTHSIFDLTLLLKNAHENNIVELKKISSSNLSPLEKLARVRELLRKYYPFLWIIIPLERYYKEKISKTAPKYINEDLDEWIAKVSVPKKKNAYVLMQEMLKEGVSLSKVHKEFAWLKSRDGFTDFYTIGELAEIKKHLNNNSPPAISVPKELSPLVDEIKELTFFRTDRTDKNYEFLGMVRPIFQEVADSIGVSFKELAFYDAKSVLANNPNKVGVPFCYLYLDGKQILQKEKFLDFGLDKSQEVKGTVAFKGKVKGIVKIVTHPNDVGKVNKGDILVAQMTLPSFISAMQKASAFVTDEGSITCHAAIIAREMHKPCITGTKNATKVLKDGDFVEVDAEIGIVKKIENESTSQNSSKPKLKNIEKSITRDLPLANSYVWHYGYSKGMLDSLGWSYSDTLFYHNGGHVDIIRDPNEQNVLFRDYVLSKITSSRKWFFKISKDYSKLLSEYESFYKKSISLSNKSNAELAKIFDEYCRLIGKIMSPFIVMYWIPNWFKDGNKENLDLKKEIDLALKYRKQSEDIFPKGDELVRVLLKKVENDLSLEKDLRNFISHEELLNYLKNGVRPNVSELKKRKLGVIYSNAGITLANESSLDNELAKLGYSYKRIIDSTEKEIKGQSAYLGKVKGKVRILLNKHEIKNFPQGFVLVTGMTTPEFVPAMKKASAIITDEGGVTCHAAIVARELKVPCIIGTKIASKVLKDGDLVEVDANNGVVRLIEDEVAQIDLVQIAKKDLSLEHIDCRWLYLDIPSYCFTTPFLDKTVPFSFVAPYINGIEMDWITDKQDHQKISKDLLEKDSKDNNYFFSMHKKWLSELDKMFNFYYKEYLSDYSKLSDNELKQKLERIWELYTKEAVFPALIDGFMFYADVRLNQLLKEFVIINKTPEQATVLFSILSAPIDESFLSEAEKDLIEIAIEKNKNKNIEKLINQHCTKYSYINASYGDFKPYTKENSIERLAELIDKNQLSKFFAGKENKKIKDALKEKYSFSKEVLQLVRLSELFTKWQDERKQTTLTHICLEAKIIEEISKRKKVDLNVLKACHYSDLFQILDKNEVPNSVLTRIKEPTLAFYIDGKIVLELSGEKATKFVSDAKGTHDSNITQIYGLVAYRGKVSGKVKVVRTFEDSSKVEEGDILVIPMTRPEHTPIMKKASAIVTDDGGITCHAAIVARELKKPCIIGTKIATHVLKDGDIVEVRANHGQVTILSRAQAKPIK